MSYKKWGFGFLSLGLIFSSAYAGSVSEDPKIAQFAREFEAADPRPELGALQPGKQWVCFEYSAKPNDDFELQYQRSYLFPSIKGGLVYNAGRDSVKTFAPTLEGIKGLSGPNDSTVIRVNREGDLIVEKKKGDQSVGYVSCIHQLLDTMPKVQVGGGVCGFRGRIQDRMADCENAGKTTSKGVRWDLVTRTVSKSGKPLIFRRDRTSGLIWSDPLEKDLTWEEAKQACQNYASIEPSGTLPSQNFFLPSEDDYIKAEKDGIREALDMKNPSPYWWSSSPGYLNHARDFHGGDGSTDYYGQAYPSSVRCVGR